MPKPGFLLLLSFLAMAPRVQAQVSGLLPPRGRDSLLAADARDSTARKERQRHLDSLAAGRRRWAARQPAEYQLQVHNDCFCFVTGPDPVPLVNVRNGVIVSRVPGRSVVFTIEQFTVEDLFNAVQRDIEDDGRRVTKLALHPTYGFPVEYGAFTVGVADVDTHYVVDSFAVVSGARAGQSGGGLASAAGPDVVPLIAVSSMPLLSHDLHVAQPFPAFRSPSPGPPR